MSKQAASNVSVCLGNTNLDSGGDRGGSEEPTQAYLGYVEESDAAIAQHPVRTTKVYA
jgi:hypothetical protein